MSQNVELFLMEPDAYKEDEMALIKSAGKPVHSQHLVFPPQTCLYAGTGQLVLSLFLSLYSLCPSPPPPPRAVQYTRWFAEQQREGWFSLPASSTSGCVVLNLPARPTDKPQWWIRGVTIQSSAYLLQHSGCFMWRPCICVWAVSFFSFYVCVCVCSLAVKMVHTLGRWVCEVSGCFEELWLERGIIGGSRKPTSRDRRRYREKKLRETDGGR